MHAILTIYKIFDDLKKENKQLLCEKACIKPMACKNEQCIRDDEAIQAHLEYANENMSELVKIIVGRRSKIVT